MGTVSPEIIERILELEDAILGDYEKVPLILALTSKKPVSLVILGPYPIISNSEEFLGTRKMEKRDIEKILSLFKSAGLHLFIGEKQIDEVRGLAAALGREIVTDRCELVPVYVSLVHNNIRRIAECQAVLTDYERGILFGYPRTAVEAFCFGWHGGLLSKGKELPQEVLLSPAHRFASFMFSRKYWEREIRIGQDWAETIRSLSPKLYQKIISAEIIYL